MVRGFVAIGIVDGRAVPTVAVLHVLDGSWHGLALDCKRRGVRLSVPGLAEGVRLESMAFAVHYVRRQRFGALAGVR